MEEILASIRRIISEDDKPEGGAAKAKGSDDVLELTEVAEEEDTAPEPEPAPEPELPEEEPEEPVEEPDEELSIDEVLDEAAESEDDELELRDEPAPPAAPATPPSASSAGLLAAQTEVAAAGSLSALVAAVDRAHGGTTLGDGNRTLEDLVKELMRPMVKEWLDENLPRLTERLVRREIERLARSAEGD